MAAPTGVCFKSMGERPGGILEHYRKRPNTNAGQLGRLKVWNMPSKAPLELPSDIAGLEAALQQLGAKRIEATLVASLAHGDALGTRDIVEATGLRQPEVSVGMQMLRTRHWVEAESVPRHGKGRPMHRYKLVARPAEILAFYESEARRTIEQFNAAMSTVRSYFSPAAMTDSMRRPPAAPATA